MDDEQTKALSYTQVKSLYGNRYGNFVGRSPIIVILSITVSPEK